jgi:hypothetical protein
MLVQHTADIFERLVRNMPPLVPKETQEDARLALEQVKNNVHLDIEELEDTMITFGMKLWPHREAFLEFYRLYEGQIGESFLIAKLPREVKQAYKRFQAEGGTFADLHTGKGPIHLFQSKHRAALCEVLVDVQKEVWDYTRQAVLSKDRVRYTKRIEEFQQIFKDIDRRLEALRDMAEDEQEHPELASEMREHVRGFEHGLCLLGPKLDYEALCNVDEHFQSRKEQRRLHQRV